MCRCPTSSASRRARRSPAAPAPPTARSSGIDVSGRDTLAVFGQGPVGLTATMLGAAMGARVIAVDIAAERLGLAKAVRRRRGHQLARDRPGAGHHGTHPRRGRRGHHGLHRAARAARWPRCGAPAPGGACASWARAATTTFDVSRDMIRKQLTLLASWTFSAMGQWECARFVADREDPARAALHPPLHARPGRRGLQLFDTQTTGKGVFTCSRRRRLIVPDVKILGIPGSLRQASFNRFGAPRGAVAAAPRREPRHLRARGHPRRTTRTTTSSRRPAWWSSRPGCARPTRSCSPRPSTTTRSPACSRTRSTGPRARYGAARGRASRWR